MEGSNATCGEVNGKNAFGAYAGFKPFIYENGNVRIEPDAPVGSDVQRQTSYNKELTEFTKAQIRCQQ